MILSIELDCAPRAIRPNDLIKGVLEGTGLIVGDFATVNPFFGQQEWVLTPDSEKEKMFKAYQPAMKHRIQELYKAGRIRYGSR